MQENARKYNKMQEIGTPATVSFWRKRYIKAGFCPLLGE
jgi:hypothetical protein